VHSASGEQAQAAVQERQAEGLTNLDEKGAKVVTREQMKETVERLDEAGTFYTFSKDKKGISVVHLVLILAEHARADFEYAALHH